MKKRENLYTIRFLSGKGLKGFIVFAVLLSFLPMNVSAQNNALEDEYRNFHGLCWGTQNTLEDACRYAHAMNYNYVLVHPVALDSGAYTNNLRFIAVNPHKIVLPEVENLTLTEERLDSLKSRWSIFYDYPNVRQYINYDQYDELKAYDLEVWTAYKNTCEKYYIWNDTTQTFPRNLALIGGDWGGYPILDIQQQAVIDWFVPYFINHVKTRMEKPSENFRFYGVASDQPGHWRLQTRVVTGKWVSGVSESAPLHDSITHEYPDMEIATYEFWMQLKSGLEEAFPDRKLVAIHEPGEIWKNWIKYLDETTYLTTEQKSNIVGDLLTIEGVDYPTLTDNRILNVDFGFSVDRIGSSSPTPNSTDEGYISDFLEVIGRYGKAGAWFNWFGRAGSGSWTSSHPISEITESMKLARVCINWDNINKVPLDERSWDWIYKVYHSTHSRADRDIIYTRQPGSNQLFVKFLNENGTVILRTGERISSIMRVNGFFEPTEDGSSDLTISNDTVSINWSTAYNRKAYIFILDSAATDINDENSGVVPNECGLSQNYPNPFNASTSIKYSVTKQCDVQLSIYNQTGQEIRMLVNEQKTAGEYSVGWNGKDAYGHEPANGIYFYRLNAGGEVFSRKMILVK